MKGLLLLSLALAIVSTTDAFVGTTRTSFPIKTPLTLTPSSTTLAMSSSANNNMEPSSPPPSLNLGLIGTNLANQALIGSTIWTGGPQYQVLMEKASFDVFGIGLGLVGLLPLLYLSRKIETSESYLLSGLNLSTNMAVLRLFGPRKRPVVALVLSGLMAGLTGVVEEVTFRGILISTLASTVGGGSVLTGAVLSTIVFAVLHTNPLSLLKPQNKDAFLDNWALLVLQLINGSIFAILYLSTGNLAVPIVAHALYDFYTFYKTHLVDVAGQMEYAEKESQMPICKNSQVQQQWVQERGEDFVTNAKQTFYLMDTNQDGRLDRKELRVALFSYGINLSLQQSQEVTQTADEDDSGDIDFQEFLEFVGPTGSTGKAVRNTLFGPL